MATPRVPSIEILRSFRFIPSPASRSRIPIHCGVTSNVSTCSRTHAPRCFSSTRSSQAQTQPQMQAQAAPPRRLPPKSAGAGGGGGQSPSPSAARRNPYAPSTRDRGPTSSEDTQTDFGAMDIYSNTPEPATSIDACTPGGFHLNNGTKITGGSGVLLVGGEAFSWKPWFSISNNPQAKSDTNTKTNTASNPSKDVPRISNLLEPKTGLLIIPPASLAILKFLHPKPDLLLIGTGSKTLMLHPSSRKYMTDELGMRIDVMDTANASAAYNLLATERGVEGGSGIGGAMLPVGWKGVL